MAMRIAARCLTRRLWSSVTSNHLKDKAAKNFCTKVGTSSNEVELELLRKQKLNLLEEYKKLLIENNALLKDGGQKPYEDPLHDAKMLFGVVFACDCYRRAYEH